jgi:hypothetical protein
MTRVPLFCCTSPIEPLLMPVLRLVNALSTAVKALPTLL